MDEGNPTLDEILSDEPLEETAPVTDEVVEPDTQEEQKVEEIVQDAEITSEEAPKAEETPKAEPEGWTYAAYSDEKQKRQKVESDYAALKAQNDAIQYQLQQMQAQQQPQDVPDYLTDPNAYTRHVQQAAQAPVMSVVAQQARQIADLKHGADKIQAADQWFTTLHPQMQQALNVASQNTPDPWGLLVQEHTKATIAQEISDPSEIEAFRQWKASQEQPQQVEQQPVNPKPNFAPSLTKVPNQGSRTPTVFTGPTPLSEIFPT